MRDALSIFDRVVSFSGSNLTREAVTQNLNVLDYDTYFNMTNLLLENNIPQVLTSFNEILGKGFEGHHFINGLASHFRDVYDDSLTDNIELNDIGYLIAMTGSDTVNQHTIKTFSKNLGEHGYFKLASSLEIANASEEQKEHFFTPNDDYINLSEAYRENPEIIEVKIKNETEYNNILNLLSFEEKSIPLFIETSKNIYLVAEFEKLQDPKENITFSYLGKKLEQDYRSSSKD